MAVYSPNFPQHDVFVVHFVFRSALRKDFSYSAWENYFFIFCVCQANFCDS